MSPFDLAAANLLSPMVLFFALGLLAALVRSDLSVPEAIAKGMALYLMLAIGFKGGVAVSEHGITGDLVAAIVVGAALSFALPVVAYALLRATTPFSTIDAAATAAHYGSISIVTFVAGTQVLTEAGIADPGYVVAVAAVMESPAIVAALFIVARKGSGGGDGMAQGDRGELIRDVLLNGSIVLLMGAFIIGVVTGKDGFEAIAPFIESPFKGVLCLFLLDMGLVAGRGLRQGARLLPPAAIAFGLYMPLISAATAALVIWPLSLGQGASALLITLAASASYIAVPAAMRLALPEAKPAIYLTLSLGVTFPFNLSIGLPLYLWIGGMVG